jgi:predicted phosphodiesterase
MRALVVGDVHLCDYTPVKRIDTFLDAQFRKIKKIRDIAEERDVDIVFLLGDVFDKARPEIWLVNKAMDYFRSFPCVVYSLVGNHDLQGCRDGVPGTALGNLFTAGVVKKLGGDTEILGVSIRAINHTREHTTKLYETATPKIIFTHNMVTPQVAPFEHIFVDDILKISKNCFIFAGDFHPPFEKFNPITNTRILNPGVLTRTSIAEKDIDPSVIYFEATPEDLVVKYEKISLGAPKGETIFDVLLHDQIKSDELNLKQFIDSISQAQFESQDLEKLVQEVGDANKVPTNIIVEAINRIKIAKTLA